MKKIYIFSVNIFIIVLVFYLFKYVSIIMALFKDLPLAEAIKSGQYMFTIKDYKYVYENHEFVAPCFSNKNETKRPIIIFGCSYAEGFSLDLKEKFSYKLYQETNRSVYNRAFSAHGPQYMLYQLENENTYKELPEPEYVVYVFIRDQLRRLYQECEVYNKSLFYKENKEGRLERITTPFYYTYLLTVYRRYIKNINRFDYEFGIKHFIYAKQLADKHWQNTKWIILIYDQYDNVIEKMAPLKKYGYELVLVKDIVPEDFFLEQKYRLSEKDFHPSKLAWEVITPSFAKKYIK